VWVDVAAGHLAAAPGRGSFADRKFYRQYLRDASGPQLCHGEFYSHIPPLKCRVNKYHNNQATVAANSLWRT